jgi:hypothetical protein
MSNPIAVNAAIDLAGSHPRNLSFVRFISMSQPHRTVRANRLLFSSLFVHCVARWAQS